MADPRFFEKSQSYSLSELAKALDCKLSDNADPDTLIEDVAPLATAGPSDISFLDNVKYKKDFQETKAAACCVLPNMVDHAPEGTACLITKSPYKTYALIAQKFYPFETPKNQISPHAVIHENAEIGQACQIDAGAVIEEGVKIGDQCHIMANAVIHKNCVIGSHCKIGASATITHAIIGDHVTIYTGVRIGQDGFGFAIDPAGHVKVPQLGRVIIEDHVEIGANTTIDRGAGPDTIIGTGTWIDNLVQIGHNVKIGRGCVIVAHVGISGSTELGDFVALGGQVGVAGHLKVGSGARVAAQSGVMRDIPPGEEQGGTPAFPMKQYMRQIAALKRLIKTKKDD